MDDHMTLGGKDIDDDDVFFTVATPINLNAIKTNKSFKNFNSVLKELNIVLPTIVSEDYFLSKKANSTMKDTVVLNKITEDDRSSYPIFLLEETNSGNVYAANVSITPDHRINIPIKNDTVNIPEGYVMYDYFVSGVMYFSNEPNTVIESVKSSFSLFYGINFFGTGSALKNEYPTEHGVMSKTGIGMSFISPNCTEENPMYGWLFPITHFFNTTNLSKPEKNTTPCKYMSYIGESNDIVSKHYNFANHIPNFPSCSAPQRSTKDALSMCGLNIENQPTCYAFSLESELVTSVSITPKNTSNSTKINVSSYHLADNAKAFEIANVTNNSVINTINVPAGVDDKEAADTVNNILQEYIECYDDHVVEFLDTNVTESVQKNSFIKTLLEV